MVERLAFSRKNRQTFLKQGQSTDYDLLVIGGGITGAGIALDAASRGLSVCLIEKGDFASGTSSKSTKLIHGGLRYLKQFEFALVKEVGRERAVLHELARHIVVPEKMVLPLIEGGTLGKIMTSLGLYIYDYLADVSDDDKRKMLDKKEIMAIEPLLPEKKLLGGSIYAEYRTDDARLTIEVLKTAHRHGATIFNYLECLAVNEEKGKAHSVVCQDHLSNQEVEIKFKHLVNATGPWVDQVRSMSEPIKGKRLYLTKGVHVVVPKSKLPIKHATYFDVPQDDRMIFAIPRLDVTYIGTTDTYYEGDKNKVVITAEEVDYLLRAVNHTFEIEDLKTSDIISSWAGIRPLIYEDGKSASEISRKDEIFEAANGMLSIAGGKLTGYRKMAERIVDLVMERIDRDHHKDKSCKTEDLFLTEPAFKAMDEYQDYAKALLAQCQALGLASPYDAYLLQNYGPLASTILEAAAKHLPQYPVEEALVHAELHYSLDHEMIATPIDFLKRRSGRLFFMPNTVKIVEKVIFQHFAKKFHLDESARAEAQTRWREAVKSVVTFA